MTSASGFHTFVHHEPGKSRALAARYFIAYKPPGAIQGGKLDDLMRAICAGPNVPDAAVIITVKHNNDDQMVHRLRSDSSAITQQRIRGRIPLYYATYDPNSGVIDVVLLDDNFRGKSAAFEKFITSKAAAWIRSGLEEIFDSSKVILHAPSGYSFQNPSGLRTQLFLKPDLALTSSASVAFVALALFHRYYVGKKKAIQDLRIVYVDTMAIAPIAYALLDLLKEAGFDKPFEIESFHSYDGLDAVPMPMHGTSLCIISASTTMSMHRKWLEEKNKDRNGVVTILSTLREHAKDVLLCIDNASTLAPTHESGLSIRIKGETFLPELEPAKKVLLSETHHRCDAEVSVLYELAGKQVIDIWRSAARPNSSPRAFFVDGSNLIKLPEFEKWMETQVGHSIKASTTLVVYQDDVASRRMAENLVQLCGQKLGLDKIALLSSRQLNTMAPSEIGGVVVCSAVVGKGSVLLDMSRALRDKHSGPRLYLIGMQVSETWDELKALSKNLRHSKNIPYDVQVFRHVATGSHLNYSFAEEVGRLYKTSKTMKVLPGPLRDRAHLLGSINRVGSSALLPFGVKLSKSMALRPGFAFWPEYTHEIHDQAVVIATIAAVMQRARESDKVVESQRLATTSYRHVLLDPENFVRYNDGLIQGAILRCALPSELDYRADHPASDFMKAVILRSLARRSNEAGEATLEFLNALASKRLQLASAHTEEIAKVVAGIASNKPLEWAVRFVASAFVPGGPNAGRDSIPF